MKQLVFGAFVSFLGLAISALVNGDSLVSVEVIIELSIVFGIIFVLMILFQVLAECLEGA